jgi:hypothetical protein
MEKFKDFNSKLQGNAQVLGVLSNNLEILNKIPRFHDYYELLVSNHKQLIDLKLLFNKDLTSEEKIKTHLRNELTDKTLTIIEVMKTFAVDKKKRNLKLKLDHFTPD